MSGFKMNEDNFNRVEFYLRRQRDDKTISQDIYDQAVHAARNASDAPLELDFADRVTAFRLAARDAAIHAAVIAFVTLLLIAVVGSFFPEALHIPCLVLLLIGSLVAAWIFLGDDLDTFRQELVEAHGRRGERVAEAILKEINERQRHNHVVREG
jgi:hypothetical protein